MRASIEGSGERRSSYEISDDQMASGSTLGGPKAVVIIKATGAIEKFYSIDAGQTLIGTLVLHHWETPSGIALPPLPGHFIVHPHQQEHVFSLANGLSVRENVFVLSGKPEGHHVDPPAAYYTVTLANDTDRTIRLATYASAQLRGATGHDVVTAYDERDRTFLAWNASNGELVRTFGCSVTPTSYETTLSNGKPSSALFPGKLANGTLPESADPIAIFHIDHVLAPGEASEVVLTLSCSTQGRGAAERTYRSCPPAADALRRTREHYDEILGRAVVITPDPEVNRGVLWAKANMLRTQALAATGWAFVNDPTRSNNSVARDTAWFAFGADYITPSFARESLLWYADHLEESGMVVEYYDIRNGKTADYDLNVNDNTPLLILALWHHYRISGDRDFLERIFPSSLKAARFLLTQRNSEGLVWCSATGTSDWGIIGWRNVISDYRLSGATTEVNSECYAAFVTIARMAGVMDEDAIASEFRQHAADLRAAINEHLLDPQTGLYYLNIDIRGNRCTDVTSDLVFPVMFGVADDAVAANIISRLSAADFWSDAGIHTVPRNDINYGPTHGYGLLGGVWAGVSFWYAFAAARFNPEFMAYALSASFRHYSRDPLRNNTVPGQFSEWLHGEALTNQGMMLSPWFPPRYLWAAIEGAAGLDLSGTSLRVTPRLAADWKWLGVCNLRVADDALTWFVVRAPELRLYASSRFEQTAPYEAYDEDISAQVHASGQFATALALRRENQVALFVGNTATHSITTALHLNADIGGSVTSRVFNSMRGAWLESQELDATTLRTGLPVQLAGKGFCVFELRQNA